MSITDKIANRLNVLTVFKILTATLALSNNSLVLIEYGYPFDIPLLKWIYAVFKEMNADGLSPLIILVGLIALFFPIKNSTLQKNKGINSFAVFFSLCITFGKSYFEIGSWDYIFRGKIQFIAAIIYMVGYFYIFKNTIIFIVEFIKEHPSVLRCETIGFIEKHLFGKHTFLFVLIVLAILTLPYYVAFFPGTIHADATEQLFQYFGHSVFTGHHPVLITKLMGGCVEIGRILFHSDNMGIALYTTFQLVCQIFIFAYAIWLLCKLRVPLILRWFALFMYGIFPLFPMYAITLAKDTGYYQCAVLFIAALIHMCHDKSTFIWWNRVLLLIASVGLCIFRKEGKYIVIIVLLTTLWQYRSKYKVLLASALLSLIAVFLVEGVYMPHRGIAKGRVQEALSIPLQQTARYMKEHSAEISSEELQALQAFFLIDIETITEKYNPELSDPVKHYAVFSSENGGVGRYLNIWFKGMMKYPSTYLQAFLNHTYGYFYPDRGCGKEPKYFLSMVGSDRWQTPFLDISFSVHNSNIRNCIGEYTMIWERLPVLKLLYSPGMYVYVLLGCFAYLLYVQKRKGTCIMLLSLLILATCILSPVNGSIRYSFPIIALTPLNLAWCFVMKRDR